MRLQTFTDVPLTLLPARGIHAIESRQVWLRARQARRLVDCPARRAATACRRRRLVHRQLMAIQRLLLPSLQAFVAAQLDECESGASHHDCQAQGWVRRGEA